MNTAPRLAPIPAAAQPAKRPSMPYRIELKVAIRDGYQCRVCGAVLVADGERRLVWVVPGAGDDIDNLALLCDPCARAHDDHPQPIDPPFERLERLV
jgi:5-methylcytosine-specific restriction endonuclease McrA